MNSKQRGSNFDFDFNLGSNFSTNRSNKPLKEQSSSSTPSFTSSFSSQPARPTSSNKPAWTHQPLPSQPARSAGLSNPTSMAGDISGKSWNSSAPIKSSVGSSLGFGIAEKNPNLFSDLLGSALGQGRGGGGGGGGGNVPLKSSAPISASKNSFSMGNMGASLPKSGGGMNSTSWSGGESLGTGFGNKSGGLGGPSMKSGGGLGASHGSQKDPFGSLVDFSTKEANSKVKTNDNGNGGSSDDHSFGDFHSAGKSSTPNNNSMGSNANMDGFGDFGMNSSAPSMGSSKKVDDFGDFDIPIQSSSQSQSKGVDPIDKWFSPSSGSGSAAVRGASGSQPFSEMDDWGMDEFGGDDGGGMTELDGLPPPPVGVTALAAKNKGMDNYKQGQHPDAIKWLTWAVILLEKAGDNATAVEVLSCRASCYKEVGEYKKAIADCTKVLEQDDENVSVLVQRALLYESSEKYKLGAEDLRTVLRIDPGNRLARSTIHRLTKMAE